MKRYASTRNFLLMVNMSYARGWEESVKLFEAQEKTNQKRKYAAGRLN